MAIRILIAFMMTISAALVSGCGEPGLDREPYLDSNPGRPLPDGPVDEAELKYETWKRTPYFIAGPHQIAPPKILPPGTRLQILDEPHDAGYTPIRTAGGIEAYVAADAIRELSGRGVDTLGEADELR